MVKIALMSGRDDQHLPKFILDLFFSSLIQRMRDFVCQEGNVNHTKVRVSVSGDGYQNVIN